LRQPVLPRLITEQKGRVLHLRWQTPRNLPFPMPVDVRIGSKIKRVEMPDGYATVPIKAGDKVEVDSEDWIFKQGDSK